MVIEKDRSYYRTVSSLGTRQPVYHKKQVQQWLSFWVHTRQFRGRGGEGVEGRGIIQVSKHGLSS